MAGRVMLAVVQAFAVLAIATPIVHASAGPPARDAPNLSTNARNAGASAQSSKKRPATPTSSKQLEMVEIDGAKQPDLLPEYVIWTQALSLVSAIKRNNIAPAMETLRLSTADADLAFAEGAQQDERDRRCGERTRRIMEGLRDAPPDKIEAAIRPAILQCRLEVLEAKDRLLDAMSPEGRATLVAWVLEGRRGIKALIPKTDLEFFRQPR